MRALLSEELRSMGTPSHTLRSGIPASPVAVGRSRVLEAIQSHARARPEALAVCEFRACREAVRWTWSQLAADVEAAASALREHAGATVLARGPGGEGLVAWMLGALCAGCRVMPVNPRTEGADRKSLAAAAGAALIVEIADDGATSIQPLGAQKSNGAGSAVSPNLASRAAIILRTSGTSGRSNIAVREERAMLADGEAVATGMALTPHDRIVLAVQLHHSYGVDMLMGAVVSGATLEILPLFDAGVLAARLTQPGAVFPGVPFMFEALARAGVAASAPRIRLALSAGSPLPPKVRENFEAAWDTPVGQLYGATELGTVCICGATAGECDPTVVGPPLPGVSIRIVDSTNPARVLGAGEEGQVAVAAPSMLTTYLDGAPPMVDGHFLTGDLGRLDDAGRLSITGRLKLVIDVGEMKVNPQEVERALDQHAGVLESLVLPLELSPTITRLRALVVARDPLAAPSESELKTFLRTRLSPAEVPRVIECVESLPRTPTGKVIRRQSPERKQ